MKQLKRLTALILIFSMILFCGVPTGSASGIIGFLEGLSEHMLSDTTWAIYLYLCGSDLESENSCATADLDSILSAGYGENISVVVCTGGAKEWQTQGISARSVDYYEAKDGALCRTRTNGNVSMGSPDTLAGFLKYCRSEYPADREMLIIWDHGGGVTGGVCYDENFDYDCLTIPEVRQAMSSSMSANISEPPLEFVVFDTCLTANIDMAAAMNGYARYMIASEEVSLSGGTRYYEILTTMMINPGIESVNLGKFMCETFALFESMYFSSGTISMLDLQKLPALLTAYESFGTEAQSKASQQGNDFYIAFSRAAHNTDRFGDVTGGSSCEMADLGHLMENCRSLLSSAQQVLNALDECVIYNKRGKSKSSSHGLACYYPYSGSMDRYPDYLAGAAGTSVPVFYKQMLSSGSIFEDKGSSAGGTSDGYLTSLFANSTYSYDGEELNIHIAGAARYLLTGLDIRLYAINQRSQQLRGYGRTHSITGDWDTGEFTAIITDKWGTLDGHLCYMDPVSESEDMNTYHVPILLNGKRHLLVVEYSYAARSYSICGTFVDDGSAIPSASLNQLSSGDRITTLLPTRDFELADTGYMEYETFTLGSSVSFTDGTLPDGYYYVPFIVTDFLNRSLLAEECILELRDGKITATDLTLDSFR